MISFPASDARNDSRFSVVIPTYNRGAVIMDTLDSVFAQTRPVDEVIVVDDGSTDDTADRLAPVMDRITYLRQDNAGVSAARNTGIRAATGDWICFLDSDDVWLPDRMAVLVRDLAEAGPEVTVHMADVLIDRDGADFTVFQNKRIAAPKGRAVPLDDPLPMVVNGAALHALAFRRDLFDRTGPFPAALRRAGDTWFLVRLAIEGCWIVTGDLAAVVRRLEAGEAGITQGGTREKGLRAQILSTEHMLPGARTPRQRRIIARRLGGLHFTLAKVLQGAERRTELAQALRCTPLWPRAWARAVWLTLIGTRGLRQP